MPTNPHTISIAATGYAYPNEVVDNAAYWRRAQFAVDDPESLARDTSTEARRWCGAGETTYTLARDAVANALLDRADLAARIDLVIVASGTSVPVIHPVDAAHPGMADLAPLLIRDLGRSGILGMDLKACYCTGFLRGLQVAEALLQTSAMRAALVVATEQGSRYATAATNRSAFCFLMADAAGAVVLAKQEAKQEGKREKGARSGILAHVGATDASRFDMVTVGPDGASMMVRGSKAGAATRELLVKTGRDLLTQAGLGIEQVDWIVPIQTHKQLLMGAMDDLGWPSDKLVWHAAQLGFSGSASIPSMLAEQVKSGRIAKGQLIASLAVGAGMNSAGTLYYI